MNMEHPPRAPLDRTTGRSSLPIAVLISGSGRSLANLLQRIDRGQLDACVKLVVSSRSDVAGVDIARRAGIFTQIVARRDYPDATAHRDAVFELCRQAGVRLVVMAGYLQHLLIPDDFVGHVINIHPSLIPKHCGQGFFGHRVHESVLRAGDTETGCTVHFVDNQYDHGPIIARRVVCVLPEDTADTLADRVFAEECELLPEVVQRFADGTCVPSDAWSA